MLEACIASAPPDNPCVLAARHHFAAGGSRLRARICLGAAKRLGVDATTSQQLACTCELLHNASLIHDDLLDRAPLRRAQASIWSSFGDGTALCTGDLMLAAAYASIANLGAATHFPALFGIVHRRAQSLILGQAAELAVFDGSTITAQQYEALAEGKSAALLSLSLELPLCTAGHEFSLPQARQVATSFAIAYQIADDLADFEQDQLAHSLNLISVLLSSTGISPDEAKEQAAARAKELLHRAINLARDLPCECAAVLVDHAETLLLRLAPTSELTALTAPSASG